MNEKKTEPFVERPFREIFMFVIFVFGVAPAVAWLFHGGYWQAMAWILNHLEK